MAPENMDLLEPFSDDFNFSTELKRPGHGLVVDVIRKLIRNLIPLLRTFFGEGSD